MTRHSSALFILINFIMSLFPLIAREVKVNVDKEKYVYEQDVNITIAPERKDDKFRFRCQVYSKNNKGEWVEFVPSLVATTYKPKDTIYEYPANSKLKWEYVGKPKYFQPQTQKKYMIVIEVIDKKKPKLYGSDEFSFADQKK